MWKEEQLQVVLTIGPLSASRNDSVGCFSPPLQTPPQEWGGLGAGEVQPNT